MYIYYFGSILVAFLGIALVVVINRLEKLEMAHKMHSSNEAAMSAFSVSAPASISTAKEMYRLQNFQTVYVNGGDFNTNTGVFTCSSRGMYYFTTTLVKRRTGKERLDQVYCYIYKNKLQQLLVKVDPTDDDTDLGNAAITNSIILSLDIGDIVYLGTCNWITNFAEWTSFSGFLLYPES